MSSAIAQVRALDDGWVGSQDVDHLDTCVLDVAGELKKAAGLHLQRVFGLELVEAQRALQDGRRISRGIERPEEQRLGSLCDPGRVAGHADVPFQRSVEAEVEPGRLAGPGARVDEDDRPRLEIEHGPAESLKPAFVNRPGSSAESRAPSV